MKNSLFSVVCFASIFVSLNAQAPNKNAFVIPVEADKPTFFDQTPFSGGESKGVLSKLYPAEDVILCLYRINDLMVAYDSL